MIFCFVQNFFFWQHKSSNINFFCRAKPQFFFENLTLGYMTKTLNHIIFFPPPKSEYFFQQHWESEYFFRKKPYPPPTPPPLQFKWSVTNLGVRTPDYIHCLPSFNIFVVWLHIGIFKHFLKQLYFRNDRRRESTFFIFNKVCQWLATGRWFSPNLPVSSSNKTDHHDITEILLKVALNTINQANINECCLPLTQ
jgi:hypothetical protein